MRTVLSDHDCEGQARAIFDVLGWMGYPDWLPIQLRTFADAGLDASADDEPVWRFCQDHGYLLLTGNRSSKAGSRSLERVIRRLVTEQSLPVLTISNLQRVEPDPDYCRRCAECLAEIVLDLDNYRGTPRLFLPGTAE
jgi:hypothetical protein